MIVEYINGLIEFDFRKVDVPAFKKEEKRIEYMQDLLFSIGNDSISILPNFNRMEPVDKKEYMVPIVARAINTSVIRSVGHVLATHILGASTLDRFKVLKNKNIKGVDVLDITDFFKIHRVLPKGLRITIKGEALKEGDRIGYISDELEINLEVKGNAELPVRTNHIVEEIIDIKYESLGDAIMQYRKDVRVDLQVVHDNIEKCIDFYTYKYIYNKNIELLTVGTLDNFNLLVPRIDTFPQLVLKRIVSLYPNIISNLKDKYASKIISILDALDISYTENIKTMTKKLISDTNEVMGMLKSLSSKNAKISNHLGALSLLLERGEKILARFIYGYNDNDIKSFKEKLEKEFKAIKANVDITNIKNMETHKLYLKFLVKFEEYFKSLTSLYSVIKIWKEFKVMKPTEETDKVFLSWLSDDGNFFEQDWFIHQCLYHISNNLK